MISLGFAKKPTTHPPEKVVRSFFVGRNVDGVLNARLVANGGLSLDGQVLDQYLPALFERFSFLSLLAIHLGRGFTPWSGDISGAYYATKGRGFIQLPHDWPQGEGGFRPNEIVELECAIPGDRLSSGLFLQQFDDLLLSQGFEILSGRTKRYRHDDGSYSYLINYSDDLLGFSTSVEHMQLIESLICKKFRVSLEPGIPPKWVGMDLVVREKGELGVGSASTFLSYDVPYAKFSLDDISKLNLAEKCTDKPAIKNALSVIGKLLYGATTNPWLTYLSSFLAAALHYDPSGASSIANAAIHYYSRRPAYLSFFAIEPKFIAIYTDASHSLATCRAHAGAWIQLQCSSDPQPRANVLTWGSEKLAKLYESVYSAEAKAVEIGLRACLKILPHVQSLFGSLAIVLFTDNKALSGTLNNKSEPHPFASSAIDFIRQTVTDNYITVKWVKTDENLADILTKPSR